MIKLQENYHTTTGDILIQLQKTFSYNYRRYSLKTTGYILIQLQETFKNTTGNLLIQL